MDDKKTITLTISEYIERVTKELNITQGTKCVYGNELELIALVRNCQFLYDKTLADFKNIQKKNEAWNSIASVFDVSVGAVQQRWKTLRDTFTKCKNKYSSDDEFSISCPFYEDLKFLEPHISARRARCNDTAVIITDQLSEEDDDSQQKKDVSFSNEDLIKFIENIKQLPVLYHQKFKSVSFRKQKVQAWVEISTNFGSPVKDCLNRWKNLRERYARERRMLAAGEVPKKWELYETLSFLDAHVKSRRKHSGSNLEQKLCYFVTNSSAETVDSSNYFHEISSMSAKEEIPSADVEFLDVCSEETASPKPIFSDEHVLAESTTMQVDNMQNAIPADEDDLFGQTIAAELKRIECPRKKIKLKADIYRLLYENC